MRGPVVDRLLTPGDEIGVKRLKIQTGHTARDSLTHLSSLCVVILQEGFHTGASLKSYVSEVLRRSRSNLSVLRVTTYYLLQVNGLRQNNRYLHSGTDSVSCPKRCFLTCLILASKYLQDQNYTLKTWSKITGLGIDELKTNETKMLELLKYKLHINEKEYDRLSKFTNKCEDMLCVNRDVSLLTPPSSPREWRDDDLPGWRATQYPDSTISVETRTKLARAIEQFVEFPATKHHDDDTF
ncbi:hypothetical protein OGAPHI_002141 [Ogataea philodendri]|uniref:Cyclin N-terminal domain-containing protein n=1 Tax=Ogataea philodendri TaxID=1378263 RepID=A0A9P8PAF2_9ASCO|nr:uncharacterized protein OGAPHI_002141 [Ogataea philodendri]KAH3668387.1 hypothetical protein OGAPHI_002141 [Ogataea philodendri]